MPGSKVNRQRYANHVGGVAGVPMNGAISRNARAMKPESVCEMDERAMTDLPYTKQELMSQMERTRLALLRLADMLKADDFHAQADQAYGAANILVNWQEELPYRMAGRSDLL